MKHPLSISLLWLALLAASVCSAQSPTPSPSPTPTPFPQLDQAVAWQSNVQHDGNNPASALSPPLAVKWRQDLTSRGVTSISYPLIAQGRIIVTTTGSNFNKSIIAFNEADGQELWSVTLGGTYGFLNAAYDANKVFVVNFDGLMRALDAATGAQLWSVQLPGQYAFTSPPVAVGGRVFVGGAGSGGTLYAVDESNGNVAWRAPVENGDHSSPAVIPGSVFVSYACPQSYAFATANGQQQWHYSGSCAGGGGKTPVVHLGKVYVRDNFFGSTNGLILDAQTGVNLGGFNSDRPPAFIGNLGVYFQSGTLRGIDISSGQVLWSFAGSGNLTSAPLIVNQTIYVGSSSGLLYALDLQGHQTWSTQIGAPIPAPDEHNAFLTTGLGSGDGLLVVPAGPVLAVYVPPARSLNISSRANVLTGDNVLIGGFIIKGAAARQVVIRAIGSSLTLPGHLVDPTLELHMPGGTVVTNDNWKINDATGQSQENELNATHLAPTEDGESAILALLAPGNYTAIVRGKNNGTGTGLVEVYDLGAATNSALANISTRGYIQTGDNVLIGGFILGPGDAPAAEIALRGIGPSLELLDTLQNPELDLRDSNGTRLATNDNWADDMSHADVQAHQLAPTDPRESALIRTLPPGPYTVIISGHDGTSGIGLVEIYNIGNG
jgi:outer membrane protein assembly factor BamB